MNEPMQYYHAGEPELIEEATQTVSTLASESHSSVFFMDSFEASAWQTEPAALASERASELEDGSGSKLYAGPTKENTGRIKQSRH